MSREPEVRTIDVQYRDAEPQNLTVPARRRTNNGSYKDVYKFKMQGSTAELSMIEPDTGRYAWPAREESREIVAEAVEELPFVQAVAMPGVDG
jgi:hypothetical protein